jgi:AcrR family transcriptional regulator
MSPRPQKASNDEVFAATQRVMSRVGPRDLLLAEIAAEAGVTAGALVQRFGSKRELLLAVVERWAEGTRQMMEGLRARHHSPLAALKAYAESVAAMGQTPGALAHHLSYLQLDLTDADFRRHMRRSAEVTRSTLAGWMAEAVAVGELKATIDVAGLVRLFEATLGGSLLSWAVYQEGSSVDWVLRDLDALLAPHMSVVAPLPAGRGVSHLE